MEIITTDNDWYKGYEDFKNISKIIYIISQHVKNSPNGILSKEKIKSIKEEFSYNELYKDYLDRYFKGYSSDEPFENFLMRSYESISKLSQKDKEELKKLAKNLMEA